jgi:hypothetical protein
LGLKHLLWSLESAVHSYQPPFRIIVPDLLAGVN